MHILDKFSAQIGELAQHQLIHDESVVKTTDYYYGFLKAVLNRNSGIQSKKSPRYLEIACYRHLLGYKLAKDRGFESTLFDINDSDLEIGRDFAFELGLPYNKVERVAGDFHDLPFSDNYFDLVFISASIHHTRSPQQIIKEVMRVLTNGGLFYSQKEPCERLFCFYKFNANRPEYFTKFEKHLQKRDLMRLISSPYPGARNAELFGRVENDHIPLDMYYDVFNRYGKVLEQVLYHEGLLTKMDKKILDKADVLNENDLSSFIAELIILEMKLAAPLLTSQDQLLGFSLPNDTEIWSLAKKTAAALKSRPTNKNSIEWQKAMASIFGASLRFVVERKSSNKQRSKKKFRRPCQLRNNVKLDNSVYHNSGLFFWDKQLPCIQSADKEDLEKTFPIQYWHIFKNSQLRVMISKTSSPQLIIQLNKPAVAVIRYRVVVDDKLPAARLCISYGGKEILNKVFAQSEDNMLRFIYSPESTNVNFQLTDLDGKVSQEETRIRVSILQCIPFSGKQGKLKNGSA
jgi:SAM-dependent methyltransferase